MTKKFCDLCGEEIKPYEGVCYKVKKEHLDITSWGGHFWGKLECHEDCWKNLCMMLNDIKTKVDFKKLVDSFYTNSTERRLNKWVEFPIEEKEKFEGNQNES